jgi:hypothetical protein
MLAMLKNKIKKLSVVLAAGTVLAAFALAPLPVLAAGPSSTQGIEAKPRDCEVSQAQLNANTCGIIKYVVVLTNILSALVGVIIVISLIWGGIQYSMAKSDPQAVAQARGRISNTVIALLLYIFMFAFLQWVIPGGPF